MNNAQAAPVLIADLEIRLRGVNSPPCLVDAVWQTILRCERLVWQSARVARRWGLLAKAEKSLCVPGQVMRRPAPP